MRYVVVIGLLLGGVGSARAADQTVAIGSISGPTGAQVRYGIESTLRDKVDVISSQDFEAAARGMNAAAGDPKAAAQVGASLQADAVVLGSIKREGREWAATVQVVASASGEVVKNWEFRSPQLRALSKIARRQAWLKLGAAIRQAAQASPAPAPAAAAPPPAAAPARAPTEQRVTLLPFDGGSVGARVRQVIGATLTKDPDFVFVRGTSVAAEAEKIGVSLEDPVGRIAVAELLELNGMVSGRAFKRGANYYAVVEAHQGRDGETIETLKLRRRSLRSLGTALAQRLKPPLKAALAPLPPPSEPGAGLSLNALPASTEEDEAAASARAEPERQRERRPRGADARSRSPLRTTLGFNTFFRTFDFNDIARNDAGLARPYESSFSPAIAVAVEWFPVAHFQDEGWLRNLGVGIDADYAFGLSSTDTFTDPDNPLEFPTNSFSFIGSLLGRLPLGASEVGAEVGFGTDRFSLDPDGSGAEAGTPNVEYTFIRLGGNGRWRVIPQLELGASAAYRAVLDGGEVASEDFFPNASIGAFDAEVVAGTPLLDPIYFELGANYQHYFYSLNPEAEDASTQQGTVIGGALDQYVTLFLRLAFVL
jgi:hypothetical protein